MAAPEEEKMEVDTNVTSGQKSKPAAAAVPAQTTSSKPLVPMSRKERKVSMFGSDDSSDENESSKSPPSKAMVQDAAVKVEVKAETEEPVASSIKDDASDEVKQATPPVVRKEKEVDRRRRSSSSHQSNKSANENDSDGKESVKSRKSTTSSSSKKGRRVSGASVSSEKRLDTAESLFDQLTVNVVGHGQEPAKSDKVSPAAASMKSPASSLLKVPSTSTKSPILKSPTLKSPGVAAAAPLGPLKSPLASASTVPGKNKSYVLKQPASCKCTLSSELFTVQSLHKVQSCTNYM